MYMQNLIRIRNIVALSTLLLLPSLTWALKADASKPLLIDANSVTFNKSAGKAIYHGNVSIVQGTLKIHAAHIEINAPNNKVISIIATGSPLTFEQRMDDGKRAKGKAKRMRYLVEDKRLILDGGAELSQNNDKFSSQHIEYSTLTGALKAGNEKNNKSRVRAIFYPSNKTN
ncbi:MAG: lipopolysaccharide transport periplasmic protein LptA [Aquificaceae bacterium]|nr:MAG: lipopolysaccharide transport periplasmic protein LptA [Aquificaceae bacterium]